MDSGGRFEAWKKLVFTTEHVFLDSTTFRARQAAAPKQAQLPACSLAHLQEVVQEVVVVVVVVKRTFSVVKNHIWGGPQAA